MLCWGCPRAHATLAYLAAFAARRAHGSLKPKDLSFKSVLYPSHLEEEEVLGDGG